MKLRLPPYCPEKPFPKQMAFLMTDELEVFFGGAVSPGKTSALLMAALQYVDQPNYAAMILRRSYTDLALPGSIMDRAHKWLRPYVEKKQIRWNRDTHTFTFPSGAKLAFGYIASREDKYRYQSAELQFIGWDELCEFPEEDDYAFMFTRLRRLKDSNIPLRVRAAGNPVGVGVPWVKRRFIDEPDEDALYIPANFYDNLDLDHDQYLRSLQKTKHPKLLEALIEGKWDIIEGQAFPDFDEDIHVVRPMVPPSDWRRWEAMDWGTTNPTAWYAASLAPTEETLIFGEYYAPGLISAHASEIHSRRENRWGQPSVAVCDPSIKARTGMSTRRGENRTVHLEFAEHGINLLPANNDRRAGFHRLAELLSPDPSRKFPDWHQLRGEYGSPRLFITADCVNLIDQIKAAPLDHVDPETVDGFWESRHGHAMAAARYLVTARVYPDRLVSEPIGAGRRASWNEWSQFNRNNWREVG